MAKQRAIEDASSPKDEPRLAKGQSTSDAPEGWPAGVRPISWAAFDLMGVDGEGLLYWDGRPVEVRRRLDLSRGERLFAVVVGIFTILGGIGAIAQGWAAAHQWACQIEIVGKGCPKK